MRCGVRWSARSVSSRNELTRPLSLETLTQALARRCSADWSDRFTAEQSATLRGCVRGAFVDTAACVLAGRTETVTEVALRWAAPRLSNRAPHPAECSSPVLFGPLRTDSATAALINAVAGHALDYDDVGLAGHPSVVLVPALMAERSRMAAVGSALDAAVLVGAYARGYAVWGELQRRVKVQLHARGWHPSAVFGAIATAAAVAHLRGLRPQPCAHALGIAASMAAGVVANFGSMTKPFQVGRAGQAGIQAVELAAAGLDASADALDGPAGLLPALTGSTSLVDLEPALPDDFEAMLLNTRPGIKKYPVCYAVHRVVDGVIDLVGRYQLAPGDIESLQASISATAAAVLRHHDPDSVTQARFSMEFCAASAAVHHRLGIAEVSPSGLSDAATRALMCKVHIETVDTRCPLEPSFAYTDRVLLKLRNGQVLDSGPIRFARGHAENPVEDSVLRDKLMSCAGTGDESLACAVLADIDRLFV